jgi:hypothetical protein
MAEKFVDAYDKNTGKKLPNPVPEAYFEIFGNLRRTPVQKANDTKAAEKSATNTKES